MHLDTVSLNTSIISFMLVSHPDELQGLVIFRTFMLWERKPHVLKLLIFGSVVANSFSIFFVFFAVRDLIGKLYYHFCGSRSN